MGRRDHRDTMTYDATVLDCDGVIVERPARETFGAAARAALDRTGLDGEPRAVAREFLDGDVDALAERCRRGGVEFTAFCRRAATAVFDAQRRQVLAGSRSAHDDVGALRSLEQPLGLVTDNDPLTVAFLLRRFDLSDLFETVRCRAVTPRGLRRQKPDARNLEAALADLDADSPVYVGDMPRDVEAAHRAGIDAVFVARPSHSVAVPEAAEHVVDGLAALSDLVE